MSSSDVITLVVAMVSCTWIICHEMNSFVTHDICRRRRKEHLSCQSAAAGEVDRARH